MVKYASILLILVCCTSLCFAQNKGDLNLGAMVQAAFPDNRMIDEDYHIWGASVVKGDDGLYHMYYSRWARELGHYAWVTHSEVAYAVAEKAEGPYNFVNVALPARGSQFWDGTTTHNPTVFKKNGKYYLYYMGTTSPVKAKQPTSMKNKDWWIYRNNQRIGVAVSDKPEGPWKRFDKPVLDISENPKAYDALMVSNPAVNYTDDGTVIMIYKAVDKTENHVPINLSTNDSYQLSKGKKVRFMVAFANNPLGPFKKHGKAIFEKKGTKEMYMVAEDPCVWYQNGKYYAIVRDNMGVYTGDIGALALLNSKNGYEWEGAKNPLVVASKFKWTDGTMSDYKLERPQILIENDVPTFLFGALGITVDEVHRGHACNLRIELK